jgi:hypothetical protein
VTCLAQVTLFRRSRKTRARACGDRMVGKGRDGLGSRDADQGREGFARLLLEIPRYVIADSCLAVGRTHSCRLGT